MKCLLSSNFLRFLAAGAWPLCVKGAVTTLVVTGGLSPSGGQQLVFHFRYNPSVFLLRKNPPPFAQGRLWHATDLYRFFRDLTPHPSRRKAAPPSPPRGRLARTLLIYCYSEHSEESSPALSHKQAHSTCDGRVAPLCKGGCHDLGRDWGIVAIRRTAVSFPFSLQSLRLFAAQKSTSLCTREALARH